LKIGDVDCDDVSTGNVDVDCLLSLVNDDDDDDDDDDDEINGSVMRRSERYGYLIFYI